MQQIFKPTPYVEIRVADAASPLGYRQTRGLVSDQFCLSTFMVEIGWVEPEPPSDETALAAWLASAAEIDIADWTLHGLIRGVNRNSGLGSSNDRSWWGDRLIQGELFRVGNDAGWSIQRYPLIQAEFLVGRIAVRIGWVTDDAALVALSIASTTWNADELDDIDLPTRGILADAWKWRDGVFETFSDTSKREVR